MSSQVRKSEKHDDAGRQKAGKSGSRTSRILTSFIYTAIAIETLLLVFNQVQINEISDVLGGVGIYSSSQSIIKESTALSSADISKIRSTAMAVAMVFPELKNAKTEEDVMNIMLPSGTPEYSEALGGISFDDPVNSLNYLAKWYFVIKEDVKRNDPEAWQRYLDLAARPVGISCEFCCGVGPQGIDAQGNLRCGCQHNPALQAITLGLIKYTEYSDAQILREIMRWKTLFFPRTMIALGMQVAGKEASDIENLAGMVGGC